MIKILVIEDDPAIIMGLSDSLEEEHFKVIKALDGQIGYQMGLSENPDLIILDLMLPSKSGMDICRDLRSSGVNVPILMLTSKK
jgi:DNA-binding response OmpR family regulator